MVPGRSGLRGLSLRQQGSGPGGQGSGDGRGGRSGRGTKPGTTSRGATAPARARPLPGRPARPPATGAGVRGAGEAIGTPSGPWRGGDGRDVITQTVVGLGYELVDIEREARGLLRVSIDRVPGTAYATGTSAFVTVDDCEAVTRQLQYVLEVEGVDYARLEVSSPGLDRPLRRPADYLRFAGMAVALTLKEPFAGRKAFKGVLGRSAPAPAADDEGWTLVFQDGKTQQVLAFALHEVREARLVPVLDFKGRAGKAADRDTGAAAQPAAAGAEGGQG
jgi:ribosome maturation factor RimP